MIEPMDVQARATLLSKNAEELRGRVRIASMTELLSSIAILGSLFYRVFAMYLGSDQSERVFAAFTNFPVLLSIAYVVMNFFSYLLNRHSLLVGLILGRQVADVEIRAALYETLEREKEFTNAELSESAAEFRERRMALESDTVESEFQQYLSRSGLAASTAQRRPNALLFIGTVIAVLGLLFFIVTLPGSRFGIVLPSGIQPGQASFPDGSSLSHDFLQLLPRLLMLIFIQLLAGFFLKQYRASMEDFRYYESILRHREAQYLSYVVRKKSEDKKLLASFAKEIMEDRPLGMLARGQTTTTLEAQRIERNEFASLYEMLADLALAAKQKTTGSAGKASPKKKTGHDGTE